MHRAPLNLGFSFLGEIMPFWLIVIIAFIVLMGAFVSGYFLGRRDERRWNLFLYDYGHYIGRREERRRHRD